MEKTRRAGAARRPGPSQLTGSAAPLHVRSDEVADVNRGRVAAGAADHEVGAAALGQQRVGTRAAVELVAGRTAGQAIRAGVADQLVRAARAGDLVGAAAALDVVREAVAGQ